MAAATIIGASFHPDDFLHLGTISDNFDNTGGRMIRRISAIAKAA